MCSVFQSLVLSRGRGDVTLDEAFQGGRRSVTLSGPEGPRTIGVTSLPAGTGCGDGSCYTLISSTNCQR